MVSQYKCAPFTLYKNIKHEVNDFHVRFRNLYLDININYFPCNPIAHFIFVDYFNFKADTQTVQGRGSCSDVIKFLSNIIKIIDKNNDYKINSFYYKIERKCNSIIFYNECKSTEFFLNPNRYYPSSIEMIKHDGKQPIINIFNSFIKILEKYE